MKIKFRIRKSQSSKKYEVEVIADMVQIPCKGDAIVGNRHEVFHVDKVIHVAKMPMYFCNDMTPAPEHQYDFVAFVLLTKIAEERASMYQDEVIEYSLQECSQL